jgi:glucokinase
VIIGGGISQAGDLLFPEIRRLIPQFVSMVPVEKVEILPAALGNESGVCGALVLAKQIYATNLQTR